MREVIEELLKRDACARNADIEQVDHVVPRPPIVGVILDSTAADISFTLGFKPELSGPSGSDNTLTWTFLLDGKPAQICGRRAMFEAAGPIGLLDLIFGSLFVPHQQ